MRNIASILTRKYSTKNSTKLTFLNKKACSTGCGHNTLYMAYFAPQFNGGKEWQRESGFGWVFVYFQWENWPHKNKNHQSDVHLGPPKGVKLHETKEKYLSTCNKWMKKKEKQFVRNGFLWKLFGSTCPSLWWFLYALSAQSAFYLLCLHL